MCSMSLTVVVSARSNGDVMRPAIWSGGNPVILPDHGDHRDADVRKDVDRRARGGERADDEKQQRENDKRIGAPQRDADDRGHSRRTPPTASIFPGIRIPVKLQITAISPGF